MNERLRILELIESGQISVAEGVQRLEGLDREEVGPECEATVEASAAARVSVPEQLDESISPPIVSIIWRVVLGVGVAIVAGGGLLLSRAYGREGMPGMTWGWVLFVLGVLVMVFGWWLQRARWFTLRVREYGGRAFTIALPLPLALVAWLLQVAEPLVPQLQGLDAHRLILAMREELREGRGMVVKVDEGEFGDQVEMVFR